MKFTRFAIFYTPEPGALADFGAAWLGWDAARGTSCPHPELPGLPVPASVLTRIPRKYGLHGTIKPPFRLADGTDADGLTTALSAFCAEQAPVCLDRLTLSRIGRFLALTPVGDTAALASLAAATVAAVDHFRAPPTPQELTRRRASRLTCRQEALLLRWGYPYVMEEFRFHLTLTGPLDKDALSATQAALAQPLAKILTGPVWIRDLTLLGEAEDGRFHHVTRSALSG